MAKRGRPKSGRVPQVQISCRIGADVEAAIDRMAGETGWSPSKVGSFVLETGLAGLFGRAEQRKRQRDTLRAQTKLHSMEVEQAKALAGARRKVREAAGLKPAKAGGANDETGIL